MSVFFHFECHLQKKLWQHFVLYYSFQSDKSAVSSKHYKDQEKHVAQCLLLEDIGTWKFTFFVFLFFSFSTLHNFSNKTYEKGCCLRRSTNSMTYFESSFHFAHVYIPWSCEIFCPNCSWSLKILINYYLFAQLWALFVTKLIKTLTIFTTHSPLSYLILQKFHLFSNK